MAKLLERLGGDAGPPFTKQLHDVVRQHDVIPCYVTLRSHIFPL